MMPISGGQDLERQVETHLIVAGARRTVGHIVGADLLGVLDDGDGLEDTLRADRNGIGAVAQDIAEDHVFDALLVILLLDVERDVARGAQRERLLLDDFQFGGREAARVGDGGMHLVALLLGEVFHTERGIETPAERQYDFSFFMLFPFLIFYFFLRLNTFFSQFRNAIR